MGSLDDQAFSYYELSMRKRAAGWGWEVKSPSGRLLMHGQHRSRAMARYYGYRSLLLLLGAPPPSQPSSTAVAGHSPRSPSGRHERL